VGHDRTAVAGDNPDLEEGNPGLAVDIVVAEADEHHWADLGCRRNQKLHGRLETRRQAHHVKLL
jgi:hypothetical protein